MKTKSSSAVDLAGIVSRVDERAELQKRIAQKQLMISNELKLKNGISHMDLVVLERNESAQTRGSTMEKIFSHILNGQQIPSSDGCGDIRDAHGATYELKASFENKANSVNLRQVRLWQPVDHYIVVSIDSDTDNSYVFKLSHEEMGKEVSCLGTATHGTKEANLLNKNIEYSITLPKKSSNKPFARWCEEYRDSDLEAQLFSKDPVYFI